VIAFNIHFNQQLYQIRLPSEATVGKDFRWIPDLSASTNRVIPFIRATQAQNLREDQCADVQASHQRMAAL